HELSGRNLSRRASAQWLSLQGALGRRGWESRASGGAANCLPLCRPLGGGQTLYAPLQVGHSASEPCFYYMESQQRAPWARSVFRLEIAALAAIKAGGADRVWSG